MFGLPPVAVGAVIAALIAGMISLLGLIISKEQKTSDFRQAWIDGLRAEISMLTAHINAIYMAKELGHGDWGVVRLDVIGINQTAAQIKLRLNPQETGSRKILDHLANLETLVQGAASVQRLNEIEEALAADAQSLLKAEWVRVRQGEFTFRLAKYCAAAVVVAVLVLFVVLATVQR
jgi:hypothetical protein